MKGHHGELIGDHTARPLSDNVAHQLIGHTGIPRSDLNGGRASAHAGRRAAAYATNLTSRHFRRHSVMRSKVLRPSGLARAQ
jgi:hypothetical protein